MYMTSDQKADYFIKKAEKNNDSASIERWTMAKQLIDELYSYYDLIKTEENQQMKVELSNVIRQALDECVLG